MIEHLFTMVSFDVLLCGMLFKDSGVKHSFP